MLSRLLDTPWKVANELQGWLSTPSVWILFSVNGISWERHWRFYGVPIIQKHRDSTMCFGPGLNLRSSTRSNPLGPNHPVILCTWKRGAVLEVGDNFGMTGGSIVAAERITIGNNVTIGANTTIMDTDFHPLDPKHRRINPQDGKTAAVVIEDDVFIGMNCLVTKGVTIGRGSVVGAGSVVRKDVSPGVILTTNRAHEIRGDR